MGFANSVSHLFRHRNSGAWTNAIDITLADTIANIPPMLLGMLMPFVWTDIPGNILGFKCGANPRIEFRGARETSAHPNTLALATFANFTTLLVGHFRTFDHV